MNKSIAVAYLTAMASLLLTSCQPAVRLVFGIKSPRQVNAAQARAYTQKHFKTPHDSYLVQEDSFYVQLYRSFDTTRQSGKNMIKGLLQPLQAIYYDNRAGDVVAMIANCDAEFAGLKLSWIKSGILDSFPPQTAFQTRNLPLPVLLNTFIPIDTGKAMLDKDYTIVVLWSKMMGRHCRNFFKELQQRVDTNRATFILASFDNFYYKTER